MQSYQFQLTQPSRPALEKLCASYPYHPSHSIFTQPNFLLFLFDLSPPKTLHVLTAFHNNTPVLLLPFTSQLRTPPLPPLLTPATNPHIPLLPPIIHPAHTPALIKSLTWLNSAYPWHKLSFPYQPPSAATQSILLSPLHPLTIPHMQTGYFACNTPKFPVPTPLLKNLQRLQRKAATQGTLALSITTDPNSSSQALDTFMVTEHSSWKQSAGTSILQDPVLSKAYHTLALNLSTTGQLQIHALTLNEIPIASQLILNDGHTLHLFKIAYNPAFSALAPGNLLLLKTLEYACAHPTLQEVSLITNPPWAVQWKPQSIQNYYTTLFSPTLQGVLLSKTTQTYRYLRKTLLQ